MYADQPQLHVLISDISKLCKCVRVCVRVCECVPVAGPRHLTVFAGQRSTMTSALSDDFMTTAFVRHILSPRCLCLSSWCRLSGTISVERTLTFQ